MKRNRVVLVGNTNSANGCRHFFLIDGEVFAGHEGLKVGENFVFTQQVLSDADAFFGQTLVVIH